MLQVRLQFLTAFENLKKICDDHIGNKWRRSGHRSPETPASCKDHQIIAVPTLIREARLRAKKIIEPFNTEKVLVGLTSEGDVI